MSAVQTAEVSNSNNFSYHNHLQNWSLSLEVSYQGNVAENGVAVVMVNLAEHWVRLVSSERLSESDLSFIKNKLSGLSLKYSTEETIPAKETILKELSDGDRIKLIEQDYLSQVELSGWQVNRLRVEEELLSSGIPLPDLQDTLKLMTVRALNYPDIVDKFRDTYQEAQENELFLIDKDTGVRTFPDLSAIPVVITDSMEQNLRTMVYSLAIAKIAVAEAINTNPDLKSFFFDGVNPIVREIMESNLIFPDYARLRFDTYCSPYQISESGLIHQIELNGNEPQGDAANSRNIAIIKELLSAVLKKSGASRQDIDFCFQGYDSPVHQVALKILDVYVSHSEPYIGLPAEPNIGFLAWRDPKTGKALSPISNTEAENSSGFFERIPGIAKTSSFDPFDIVGFKEIPSATDSAAIIPVIRLKDGREMEIHFIRRLSGRLSGADGVWTSLKELRPEIYYKFIGRQHDEFNPKGQRIPDWMWMNPLNSFLTDKKLDAILSSPALAKRFQVDSLIREKLQKIYVSAPESENELKADKILADCAMYIPRTRMLRRDMLYHGDSNKGGCLSQAEIDEIKQNRENYVIKLDSLTGVSGKGVFLGSKFQINELPRALTDYISENDLKDFSFENFSRTERRLNREGDTVKAEEYRKILWKALVDYAIERKQAIVQNLVPQFEGPVARMHYDPKAVGEKVEIYPPADYTIDFNPQAFGWEISLLHSRGSNAKSGRSNITSGEGLRTVVIPSQNARRIAATFWAYQK